MSIVKQFLFLSFFVFEWNCSGQYYLNNTGEIDTTKWVLISRGFSRSPVIDSVTGEFLIDTSMYYMMPDYETYWMVDKNSDEYRLYLSVMEGIQNQNVSDTTVKKEFISPFGAGCQHLDTMSIHIDENEYQLNKNDFKLTRFKNGKSRWILEFPDLREYDCLEMYHTSEIVKNKERKIICIMAIKNGQIEERRVVDIPSGKIFN